MFATFLIEQNLLREVDGKLFDYGLSQLTV